MSTTHTPGPWYPERPYGEDGVYVACAVTSAIVCKLSKVDGRFYQDAQESIDANARLIASAPELLALAEAYVVAFSLCETASAPNAHKELLAQVRAAIRKAKGQE